MILATDSDHGYYTTLQRTCGVIDPNLKIVLEEIEKSKEEFMQRSDDHEMKWEHRFADFDNACIA